MAGLRDIFPRGPPSEHSQETAPFLRRSRPDRWRAFLSGNKPCHAWVRVILMKLMASQYPHKWVRKRLVNDGRCARDTPLTRYERTGFIGDRTEAPFKSGPLVPPFKYGIFPIGIICTIHPASHLLVETYVIQPRWASLMKLMASPYHKGWVRKGARPTCMSRRYYWNDREQRIIS